MFVLGYAGKTAGNAIIGIKDNLMHSAAATGVVLAHVVGETLSMVTFEKIKFFNTVGDEARGFSKVILPLAYGYVAKIVNPNLKIDFESVFYKPAPTCISKLIADPIHQYARAAAASESFWTKHIISRLSFALAASAYVVTKTADLALGLAVAAFSLVPCFGRAEEVHEFALQQLRALNVIDMVVLCAHQFFNPKFNTKRPID